MVKELKGFQCEICFKTWETHKSAKQCQTNHGKKKIWKKEYSNKSLTKEQQMRYSGEFRLY